jgi:hypothetical protein
VTSPPDDLYNCIAWAAGDPHRWWWPDPYHERHWPAGAPRNEPLAAFRAAFTMLGYEPCAVDEREPDFEKVALFADPDLFPTHAARQLPDGLWTSKLGELEDIQHALHDLEGMAYGAVVQVMRRPSAPAVS